MTDKEASRREGSKLVLGTVQFGLDYGISNVTGRPGEADVDRMLRRAHAGGIDTLDTAAAYGEAEAVLGRLGEPDEFRIITKIMPVAQAEIDSDALLQVETAFAQSLDRLARQRVSGLMAHHGSDLLKPGGERLFQLLTTLREKGLTDRIGASVYDPDEAEAIIAQFPIDLIQLPFNIVDQRASQSGLLARLQARGVEVHVRSAFLQGALLMAPESLPEHLKPLRPVVTALRAACELRGWTVQQACLRFVAGTVGVDRVVCGVNSVGELDELIANFQDKHDGFDFTRFATNDSMLINPSKWPRK